MRMIAEEGCGAILYLHNTSRGFEIETTPSAHGAFEPDGAAVVKTESGRLMLHPELRSREGTQARTGRILRAIGFEVKLRPFIQRNDGSAKGDWDVGITLDVLEYAPEADVVVLASGDGDFDLLVQKVRDKHGVSVEVYGVADLTAASLIRAADRFVPIREPLLLRAGGERAAGD